jgi:regulator of protease activity HflC (stomatin/prohibitin superfamily)
MRYLKASPTTFVMQHRRGRPVREGEGLSFFYFAPFSIISQVSVASVDAPFVFNETTADFQDATIQGELTYRVSDPKRAASLLDFTVNARGYYNSDDPDKLADRLVNAAQIVARSFAAKRSLAELLVSSDLLAAAALAGLKQSAAVDMLGVEILGLSVLSIKAAPEMTKALQTDAREHLLRKADEAIHIRRNAAVELERIIKENELNTEIAVEQKKRTIRETCMQADIAVEEQRSGLVELKTANDKQEAEARAAALRATLEPLKEVDWRTLIAASSNAADPKSLIAMAFRDLADNAQKIGRLSISPDLLDSLLSSRDE